MTESAQFTPQVFRPPRARLAAGWIAAVRATCESRDDVARAHWVSTEYTDPPITYQDELHLELADPPGDYGVPMDFWREFQLAESPLGSSLLITYTPGRLLPAVRRVSTVVWERQM